MPNNDVQAFLARLQEDESLQRTFKDAEIASTIALAQKVGFSFNREELEKVSSEISEEDLEEVVGGHSWNSHFYPEPSWPKVGLGAIEGYIPPDVLIRQQKLEKYNATRGRR